MCLLFSIPEFTSKTLIKQSLLEESVNKKLSYKYTCMIYPPMPVSPC